MLKLFLLSISLSLVMAGNAVRANQTIQTPTETPQIFKPIKVPAPINTVLPQPMGVVSRAANPKQADPKPVTEKEQPAPVPIYRQPSPEKYDGDCTGNETAGRCADK